jgi:ABC-type amino acid transport substrate-binding protein
MLASALVSTAPASAHTTAQTDDDWARVKNAKKMLVGSSLDYPPFAFYNQFRPDGFDIELMKEIGKKLGVTIEFNDFAFDGLLDALQLKQVDSAIGAISETSDRAQVVDFSNVYFNGTDGVLAPQDSSITSIKALADLAKYKVGVQTASVYEAGITDALVDTDQMPASNLVAYVNATDMIRDLRAKRIDLAVLDLQPAQEAVKGGGLKLVGQGTYPQSYAIPVRKGSTLLPQINQALAQLQADGTITRLAQKYLRVTPATPTPVPTTAPPPCLNGATYVADLNFNDQNMTAPPVLQPGQSFRKGWRMLNSGTCNWTANYQMIYAGGNSPLAQMSGQPTPIGKVVAPGQTADIYVNLVAPTLPGTYQGFWQLATSQGRGFGEKVWVGIQVPAPPPPVQPTQTPVPGINFSVSSTNIQQGQCVTFSWNVQGVQGVWFYPSGQPYQNYGVPGVSSQQECPQQTTTYNLLVQFNNGQTTQRSITVNVTPVNQAPVIVSFTANPNGNVPVGTCINFAWQVTGPTNRVALVRNGQAVYDGAPLNGTWQDCQAPLGYVQYTLQAFGPGGTVSQNIGINIIGSGQPTPTPVPLPTAAP